MNDVEKVETKEGRAFLPYCSNVSHKIKRVLSKFEIKTVFKPPTKIKEFLRSPKDTIPLSTPGVYKVPCSCGKSYISQTRRSIRTRLGEHIKAVQKNKPAKSGICEHLVYVLPEEHHEILFHETKVVSPEVYYLPRLVREAIEIKLQDNYNRDDSFKLSPSWNTVLNGLKKQNNIHHNKNSAVSFFCRTLNNNNNNNNQIISHNYNLRSSNRLNNFQNQPQN